MTSRSARSGALPQDVRRCLGVHAASRASMADDPARATPASSGPWQPGLCAWNPLVDRRPDVEPGPAHQYRQPPLWRGSRRWRRRATAGNQRRWCLGTSQMSIKVKRDEPSRSATSLRGPDVPAPYSCIESALMTPRRPLPGQAHRARTSRPRCARHTITAAASQQSVSQERAAFLASSRTQLTPGGPRRRPGVRLQNRAAVPARRAAAVLLPQSAPASA